MCVYLAQDHHGAVTSFFLALCLSNILFFWKESPNFDDGSDYYYYYYSENILPHLNSDFSWVAFGSTNCYYYLDGF